MRDYGHRISLTPRKNFRKIAMYVKIIKKCGKSGWEPFVDFQSPTPLTKHIWYSFKNFFRYPILKFLFFSGLFVCVCALMLLGSINMYVGVYILRMWMLMQEQAWVHKMKEVSIVARHNAIIITMPDRYAIDTTSNDGCHYMDGCMKVWNVGCHITLPGKILLCNKYIYSLPVLIEKKNFVIKITFGYVISIIRFLNAENRYIFLGYEFIVWVLKILLEILKVFINVVHSSWLKKRR